MSIHDDMILDLDDFDFNQIDESEVEEVVEEVEQEAGDGDWLEDGDDDVEVEEVEDEDETSDFKAAEFDQSFSLLPDEYEISIGDVKIAKKDLADVVFAREDIKNTQRTLDTYCANLASRQSIVEASLAVAKTEVEKQLEYVDSILNDDDAEPAKLKQAMLAKRQLLAREQQLRTEAQKAQAAIAEQEQQAINIRIQNTMKNVVGGKKAIEDVINYAQKLGIDDGLAKHISPELVKVFQDAMRYNHSMAKNKELLSKTKATKAPKSSTSKATASKAAASKKAVMVNKMKRGELTGADAFAFIQD